MEPNDPAHPTRRVVQREIEHEVVHEDPVVERTQPLYVQRPPVVGATRPVYMADDTLPPDERSWMPWLVAGLIALIAIILLAALVARRHTETAPTSTTAVAVAPPTFV